MNLETASTEGHPMPRHSSASRAFKVRSSAERLRPPPELTAAEKRIFVELVTNNKPEHFKPSDMPLLLAYVHACALETALARQINKDSPTLMRWERACKVMTALCQRLRLSPQSRTPTHTAPRPNANGAQHAPINYFEKMRLQEDGDEA
jgi:hypothetical protein